jgi:dTDP-4-dehydrorhamnose reductase
MLGSMVARVLTNDAGMRVSTAARHAPDGTRRAGIDHTFEAGRDPIGPLLDTDSYDWVVNAIGIIKPRIEEAVAGSVEQALLVNALFPYRLASESAARGQRVIQIATDGVFAGTTGGYDEAADHDAADVYGKTKSLGEVPAPNVVHLRCSIVGPDSSDSLLGWALSAPRDAHIKGFTNHLWNGITTLHFAKLCAAVIAGTEVPAMTHVVPSGTLDKASLLEAALLAFGRDDVTVDRQAADVAVDRTLTTRDPAANGRLWAGAGYAVPPTIPGMLIELGNAASPLGSPQTGVL